MAEKRGWSHLSLMLLREGGLIKRCPVGLTKNVWLALSSVLKKLGMFMVRTATAVGLRSDVSAGDRTTVTGAG